MSYLRDVSHLNELIERSIKTEEIQKTLKNIRVDHDVLIESVVKNTNSIWGAAADQIEEVNLIERRQERILARIPFFIKWLFAVFPSLRSLFIDKRDLENARNKADDAIIYYGIIPQLRIILNKTYWESKEVKHGKKKYT